jgi:hypothetical protein
VRSRCASARLSKLARFFFTSNNLLSLPRKGDLLWLETI